MSFVKYVSSLLESDHNKKFVAFFGLMVVNVSLLLIVTLSRASHTTYTYNPTSAICLAEMIKFSISAFTYFSATGGGGAVTEARSHMSRPLIMSYAVLALIYCVNNQFTFMVLSRTSPGNLALFKSSTPFLTAILMYFMYGIKLSKLQWVAVMLLTCGITLTQWNDCQGSLRIDGPTFIMLVCSCTLTAFSSVLNADVIKKLEAPMMVQNMVLYGFGVTLNLWAFMLSANGLLYGSNSAGFFEGYDNFFALAVVFLNGLIGVVMTVLYKYGDAIIKCFATVMSSMVLVILSCIFFDQPATVSSIAGCIVVFTASYIYLILGPELTKAMAFRKEGTEQEMALPTEKASLLQGSSSEA